MNTVEKMCTHVCTHFVQNAKCKNDTCWDYSINQREGG
jgi:hypothetical protein